MAHSRLQSPKPSSRHGSRPQSRQAGNEDDDELAMYCINFNNLDQLIADRLEKFSKSNSVEDEEKKKKYPLHNVKMLTDLLIAPKTPIPSGDREMLLNQLYTLNVKNPTSSRDLFPEMVQLFKISQAYDRLIAIRNVAATAVAHCDDFADEIIEFLSYLESKILSEDLENPFKEQYIYAYAVMTLAVYEGSGTFGVDDKLHFLTDTLLGYGTDVDTNTDVISALLYGIGGLFTLLLNSSALNEEYETLLESSMEYFLDYDIDLPIHRPMAMLIALAYETYDYSDEDGEAFDEPAPYDNTYLIEQRLKELVSGAKSVTKKTSAMDSRSVFREAMHTVEYYSDKAKRLEIMDKSYPDSSRQVLTHVRLSKSRSIAVKSWVALFRLVLLKWVFGVGLHNQLAHSSSLSSMVQYSPSFKIVKELTNDESDVDDNDDMYHEKSHVSHKRKQKEIANRRMEKLTSKLDQSGLNDEDEP